MSLISQAFPLSLPLAKSAAGSVITTVNGKQILDGCSGAISCSIGHGNEYVSSVMARQASELSLPTGPSLEARLRIT